MDKKYVFDIKSFNKLIIWKLIFLFLLITLIFSILTFEAYRNLISELIIVGLSGIICLIIYFRKLKSYRSAWIKFSENQIYYFKVIKDGINDAIVDGVSSYIYEDRLAIIKSISNVNVNKNNIIINGDIEIEKSLSKTHSNYKTKNVNYIKIPLYFEKNDEIIENISKYIVK